jgi:hypothetical protein
MANYSGENISYGFDTAQFIVMKLIKYDGVPLCGHHTKKSAFDNTYRHICVISYAGICLGLTQKLSLSSYSSLSSAVAYGKPLRVYVSS